MIPFVFWRLDMDWGGFTFGFCYYEECNVCLIYNALLVFILWQTLFCCGRWLDTHS